MKKQFEISLKEWNWKNQRVWEWEHETPIPVILNRIETWYYQTQEIEIDINSIDTSSYGFTINDMFDFINHYNLVINSDLNYPVIVNRKWRILDWRHRLAKAIIEWKDKIKAIQILDANVI